MNMNTLVFYITERALLNMESYVSCEIVKHVSAKKYSDLELKLYARINVCLEMYQ